MIELPKDFKEFLQLLNSKKIEYLIVGGYAVGFHGYPEQPVSYPGTACLISEGE